MANARYRHIALGAALMLAMAGSADAMTVLGVYNTGVDTAGHALPGGNGATDPHYSIVGSTSSYAVVGEQAKTFDEFGYFSPDTAGSRAINATGNGDADWYSTIIFRTTFDLTGYSPASASLSGTAQADDAATIELNGHPLTTLPIGYDAATTFATTDATFFVNGVNVLDFIVHNNTGHTALRVGDLSVSAMVPEPGTWALFVAGFGATGAAARRRRAAGGGRTP